MIGVIDAARELRPLGEFLIHQRLRGFDVPQEPHFDPESLAAFEPLLRASASYLEFGSGGSTMLANRYGVPTLTIESDPYYARSVREALADDVLARVLVADIGITVQWGAPLMKRPTNRRVRRWRKYVDAPFQPHVSEAHEFPDLILVDGRFRVACALRSAKEASARNRPITMCIDDYADRPWYHAVEEFLGHPRMAGRMAIFQCDPISAGCGLDDAIDLAVADWR